MSNANPPSLGTAGNKIAVRSMAATFRLECAYCGWGDHNTDWHEAEQERQHGKAQP